MHLSVVVLPVPGPPVMTSTPSRATASTASRCSSQRCMPPCSSASAMACAASPSSLPPSKERNRRVRRKAASVSASWYQGR